MSEKMYPIPFASLMNWVVTEYAQSGDIFGVEGEGFHVIASIASVRITNTGTLSGPTLDAACALIELTTGGKNPVHLPNGEVRSWVEDGDAIILRGWCEKPGAARIGFGECVGTVLPAKAG